MNLSRFRPWFTIRRLMAAVAIVGLMLGVVGALWRRSDAYRRAANAEANTVLELVTSLRGTRGEERNKIRYRMHWHLARHDRLFRVAERPWLPVETDPPEPE